jgi:anti-sigma regulatory factor (Ser/Thr protein kinase)
VTDCLEPGTILFSYTDGLVERRDEPLDRRLAVLLDEIATSAALPLRRLPEAIAAALLADGARPDDVAILAAQLTSSAELNLRLPAEPRSLAVVRRALAGFLGRAEATGDEIFELQVACGEACANVVEHAYGTRPGFIRVHGARTESGVTISVRDTGRWKDADPERGASGGHGLPLMRAFADELDIRAQQPSGTDVVIVRRLGSG